MVPSQIFFPQIFINYYIGEEGNIRSRGELSRGKFKTESMERSTGQNRTVWHHQVFSVALKVEPAHQMFVKIAISANITHRWFIYLSLE